MPSDPAQWGSTLSPGADLTVPGSTEKLGGWQVGKPRRQYMNWWQQAVYRWIAWLVGMEGETFEWTNDHAFSGVVTSAHTPAAPTDVLRLADISALPANVALTAGADWMITSSRMRKQSNTLVVLVLTAVASSGGFLSEITTLPSGYRPSITIGGSGCDDTAQTPFVFIINTDGTVVLRQSAGSGNIYRLMVTFFGT